METNFGQKLTEDEIKSYTPNRNLQLTLPSEVERLKKVIKEKDALISKFKSYDAKRTDEFRRLQQNNKIMEERFVEFNDAIDACEGIDDRKEFYKEVIKKLYSNVVETDLLLSSVYIVASKLESMKDIIGSLECCINCVGNAEKRLALTEELKKLVRLHWNILSKVNNIKNRLKMLK